MPWAAPVMMQTFPFNLCAARGEVVVEGIGVTLGLNKAFEWVGSIGIPKVYFVDHLLGQDFAAHAWPIPLHTYSL